AGEPHTRLRYQCSPYHTNSALRPVIAQLERAAAFKADETSEQRLDKLEAVLAMGASQVQTVAPLFAALLSVPFGERYPPPALSPTQQRRRTVAALLDQFEGLARRQPILLYLETESEVSCGSPDFDLITEVSDAVCEPGYGFGRVATGEVFG